ncbi:MAG TPA: hypothetical protein VD866_03175, partial [Urbifossiella sp.]|nr:hypothetical protein [Urbifossiella sp.]
MSSTAIGSASVVLSANADGLAAGLDQAERKVSDFAGDVGRKLDNVGGKGGGGGFLSKLLGGAALGGAAGAVGGLVAGGIMKGFEVLSGIPDMIRGFAEKATGPEAGPLQGIVAAMDQVGATVSEVGGKFFAAFGPGILAVSDVAAGLSDRFGDLIDKVGAGLGAAFTVGVELAGSLLTAVGELIEGFFGWATGVAGVSDSTEGLSTVAFAVFRGIGKAVAYTWDT